MVGVYPMRIARFVLDQAGGMNGHGNGNGNGYHAPSDSREPKHEPDAPPRGTPIYERGPEPPSPE